MTAPPSAASLPAIWVNGARQPAEAAHVSARDRGLTLADGLFETMPVYGGTVFRLDRHLARLGRGLSALGIRARPEIRDWVLDAVRGASGPGGSGDSGALDAGLRLTVTRGVGPGGVAPPLPPVLPTVVVVVDARPQVPPAVFEAGIAAHVASGRRNERAMTAGLKTLAYTDAVLALLEARRAGADEALLLDTDGHCAEATSSNLFLWTGDTLVTPPVSCGALPGVTREAVLEIAAALGVPAVERPFGLEALAAGHEAFLTSSLRGIAPLVRVGGHPIGGGVPGALTRQLTDAYTALVARECGARVARI